MPVVSRLDREEEARAVLGPGAYDYVATGAGDEDTLAANVAAWRRWWLRPRVLRDVTEVDVRTTLLGADVASPVMVAPTGYQSVVHPDGEVASARAAAGAGALYVLSMRSGRSVEDVAAVAGAWWLQVYVLRDRGLTADVVRRSVAAGARALVLTGDTPVISTRTRVSGSDPVRGDLSREQAPDVTYADIAWLRELAGGLPVVVKGVLRADDARACVDAGAAAVWVSNHGGRQLDGVVPTAVALPEVAEAVGDDGEVYVDGGIRSGRDVLRALALGARAVGLGRPVLWSLAVGGSPGVHDLLTGFAGETVEAMRLSGVRSPREVTRDLVTSAQTS